MSITSGHFASTSTSFMDHLTFTFQNSASEQRRNVTPYGTPQQIKVITTLQQPNDPAGSMFLRNAQNFLGHLRKIGVFEHKAAKRIAPARVKPGGNDNQIRRELSFDFVERIGKGLPVITSRRARRERNI